MAKQQKKDPAANTLDNAVTGLPHESVDVDTAGVSAKTADDPEPKEATPAPKAKAKAKPANSGLFDDEFGDNPPMYDERAFREMTPKQRESACKRMAAVADLPHFMGMERAHSVPIRDALKADSNALFRFRVSDKGRDWARKLGTTRRSGGSDVPVLEFVRISNTGAKVKTAAPLDEEFEFQLSATAAMYVYAKYVKECARKSPKSTHGLLAYCGRVQSRTAGLID